MKMFFKTVPRYKPQDATAYESVLFQATSHYLDQC